MHFFKVLVGQIKAKFQTDPQGQLEEADAIILEFHPTGAIRKGMCETRLLLQIMPKNGRNYITECCKYFDNVQLHDLNAGTKTKIYFRHNEPFKIRWVKT